MERGSAKHGPRLDEQQKHETEGMVRSGRSTHAEEWKETEPAPGDEEEGLTPMAGPPSHEPVTPQGMSPGGVEFRSTLARWLSDAGFPAGRDKLIAHAEAMEAPDTVVQAVTSLPDWEYMNISEVAQALGLGVETRRQ